MAFLQGAQIASFVQPKLKPNDFSFMIINDKQKHQILTFKKLKPFFL